MPLNGPVQLRILLDNSSVEVFINEGAHTMTALYFGQPGQGGVSFTATGQTEILRLERWMIGEERKG